MSHTVDDKALDTLFREARTFSTWQPQPVSDETLRHLYELVKWGPTSANAGPGRFAFLRSPESKQRLRPALAPLNVGKTMSAPVTVIVAYDLKFYEQLPRLFPHNPGMAQLFESNPEMVETTAKRNSRPRITATCTMPACSASRSPKSTAGSVRTTRPMRWRPPRSAATAAPPR